MMHWYNDMGGWGYLMMALNMVLFWGLLITAIILLIRYFGAGRQGGAARGGEHAGRILAERFARGEINEDEYHGRLDALRRSGH